MKLTHCEGAASRAGFTAFRQNGREYSGWKTPAKAEPRMGQSVTIYRRHEPAPGSRNSAAIRALIESAMYCTQCGAHLDDSARYCISCGKPTGVDSSAGDGQTGSASAESGGASATASPKRLRRILAGKKIAGVCAGFAEYFDTDITLMRVIWVALLLIPPHIGLIAYVVSWAVLPKS
jgi:phage shock protein C